MMLVKSKVKDALKGMRVSEGFYEALDREVSRLVKDAMKRAEGNGRKTLRDYDL